MSASVLGQGIGSHSPAQPRVREGSLHRIVPERWEIAAGIAFWTLYVVVDASHWLTLSAAVRSHDTDAVTIGLSVLEGACWLVCTPFIFRLVRRVRAISTRPGMWAAMLALAGVPLALAFSYANMRLRFAAGFLPPGIDVFKARRFALWFGFLSAGSIYAIVVVAAVARGYVRRSQTDRERAAQVEAQLASAQLDALRRQLDPHFLFNTLNLISAIAEDDPRGARRMISRLGELLRFSLEGAQAPEISVREELALLDRYLDIMRMRFEGRLEIDVCADDRTLGALVPSMILQPLAENAIRYGVEKLRGPGRLEIETTLDEDTVVLRVRDNGPGIPWARELGEFDAPLEPGRTGPGVGLRNTVARLAQLYGRAARFTLAPNPGGGTLAEVRVPYRSDTELRVAGVVTTTGEQDAT